MKLTKVEKANLPLRKEGRERKLKAIDKIFKLLDLHYPLIQNRKERFTFLEILRKAKEKEQKDLQDINKMINQ